MKKSLLFAILCVAASFGCSTAPVATVTPGAAATAAPPTLSTASKSVLTEAEQVLAPALVQTIAAVGQAELSGGKVSAASAALSAAQAIWANVGNINSGQTVASLITQATGNSLPGLASAAATAFSKSTGADSGAKANALAAIISALAGAPPPANTVL